MTSLMVHKQNLQYQKIEKQPTMLGEQKPPKWKMFLLTFPAAYILSTLIVIPLLALLPTWPFIAINLIVNILLAFLLTYVALPLLMHVFRSWLSEQATQRIIQHEEISEAKRFGEDERPQCAECSQL